MRGPARSLGVLLLSLLLALTAMGGAAFGAVTAAEGRWLWQNPLPQGSGVQAVAFADAANGWAITSMPGVVLHTADGGQTWTGQSLGTGDILRDLDFVDAQHGFVVGDAGALLRTADGGQTWQRLYGGDEYGDTFWSVECVDAQTAWASLESGQILRTTDGGDSWELQRDTGEGRVFDLDFVDGQRGWALSTWYDWELEQDRASLLRTVDGGQTWTETALSGIDPLGIEFTDSTRGCLVGAEGVVRTTANGGASWTARASGTTEMLTDVAFASATTGWAVGDAGTVRKTTDGGASWTAVTSGVDTNLFAVDAPDASHALAAGDGGAMTRTANGSAWTAASSAATRSGITDLDFSDPSSGLAVCEDGGVVRTVDGGATWSPVDPGVTVALHDVDLADGLNAWAVGDGGTILRSANGGLTWAPQASGTLLDLYAVRFLTASTGFAVGEAGVVLRTTNGGVSWDPQYSATETLLTDVIFTDADTGIAAGGGEMLRTTDGGSNWTPVVDGAGGWETLALAGGDVLVAGTDDMGEAVVRRSEDGGETWQATSGLGASSGISGMTFGSAEKGWVIEQSPYDAFAFLYRTFDGGRTWEEAGTVDYTGTWVLASAGERDYWLAGGGGAILKADPATLPGDISGTVRLAADGTLLDAIEVSLQTWDAENEGWNTLESVQSLPDGTYAFDNVDPGRYRIEAADPLDTYALVDPVEFTLGGSEEKVLDLDMVLAGRISGVVRDAAGDPIPGATVFLMDSEDFPYGPQTERTDSMGRYTFPGARWGERLGGIYFVGAYSPGYSARFYPGVAEPELASPIAFTLGDVYENRDLTLPARDVKPLPAASKANSDETNRRLGRLQVAVRDRKAAWLEGSLSNGSVAVGMADLATGTRSRLETAAANIAVSGRYLIADETVFEFGSSEPVYSLEYDGSLDGLACDDSHAVFLTRNGESAELTVLDLTDFSTTTIDVGESYWWLAPDAVVGGRVVLTTHDAIAVYDLSGETEPVRIEADYASAALTADGVYYTEGGNIWCRELGSGVEPYVVYSAPEGSYVGGVRSDGTDLVFRMWAMDWEAEPLGVSGVELMHIDYPSGAVKTLQTDPGPYEFVPQAQYAFSGDDLLVTADRIGPEEDAFRVDHVSIASLDTERLDEPSFAKPSRSNVVVAGTRVAWVDDRNADFGTSGGESLYLRDMTSGAERLISREVSTHWDQPCLSDTYLVYAQSIVADEESWLDLYAYDLVAGTTRKLDSNVDWNALSMQIDGSTFFYTDYADGTTVLRRVNLVTGASSEVTSMDTEGDAVTFRASNGKVLYQGPDALWLYDVATGTRSAVTGDIRFEGVDAWFAFDYPHAVYYDPNAGGWGDEQYGPVSMYDFVTGEETLIEPLYVTTTTRPFALSGDTLVMGDLVKRLDTGEEFRLPKMPGRGVALDGLNVAFDAYNQDDYWSSDAYWMQLPFAPAVRDTTPPNTAIAGVPSGWSTGTVTFSLTASDTGGSGVADTFYRLGGSVKTTYTVPVPVTEEGTTSVRYWSVDASGNVEATKTANVRIDKTAPVTSTDAKTDYWDAATVRFSVVETASGLASTRYTIDSGAAKTGSSATVAIAGAHTLRFSSVDTAGNREATQTVTFTVTPRTYDSVEGPGRYDTAAEASKRAFPSAGSADTIVLATGMNWPDALGGASLAGAYEGPLLLTTPKTLAPQVAAEARRLDVDRVVILGSAAAVSDDVETQLKALDVNGHRLEVLRLGGAGRYDTAALIASATVDVLKAKGRVYDGTAFFATGLNFPDALAASPIAASTGWPLLLVRPDSVPSPTENAIAGLDITRAVVLGSENALPKPVADRLQALTGSTPERVYGPGRYETAMEVARFGVANGLEWDGVALAVGDNFPDALAGGVMQGRLGSVILLTPPASLHPGVATLLSSKKAEITSVRYLGSPRALQQPVRDAVANALK